MKQSNFKLKQSVSRSMNKTLILAIATTLLLIMIGAIAIYVYQYRHTPRVSIDPNATDATIKSAKDYVSDKSENNYADSGTPQGSTSDQIPQSQNIKVTINNFSQNDGFVKSSATISGTNNIGNCVFTYTSTDSRPVVEQVSSTEQSGLQACNTSLSEVLFDKIGSWNLDVTFFQKNTKASASIQVAVN